MPSLNDGFSLKTSKLFQHEHFKLNVRIINKEKALFDFFSYDLAGKYLTPFDL